MYICIYIYTYIHVYKPTPACLCRCPRTHGCSVMYAYIYIYIHIYIYVYTPAIYIYGTDGFDACTRYVNVQQCMHRWIACMYLLASTFCTHACTCLPLHLVNYSTLYSTTILPYTSESSYLLYIYIYIYILHICLL